MVSKLNQWTLLSAVCVNNPQDWAEAINDYSCQRWGELGFCASYGDTYFNSDGVSANRACCVCGGGRLLDNCQLPADQTVPSGRGHTGGCTPNGWLQHDSSCVYECDPGYTLDGSIPVCYDGASSRAFCPLRLKRNRTIAEQLYALAQVCWNMIRVIRWTACHQSTQTGWTSLIVSSGVQSLSHLLSAGCCWLTHLNLCTRFRCLSLHVSSGGMRRLHRPVPASSAWAGCV